MNKIIIALALLIAVNAHFLPKEENDMFLFTRFLQQHDKSYDTIEEFRARFQIFRDNLMIVGEVESFSPFMDQSVEEFNKGLNLDVASMAEFRSTMERYEIRNPEAELPKNFDWRTKGAVSHVKNQGACGSCWAFSAVANIEGLYAQKHGKIVTFSEQELVDCDQNDSGCGGGWMDRAFQYLQSHVLEDDADYPYIGKQQTCKSHHAKITAQVTGFKDISSNEDLIARTLVENGPLSIAVNANPFQFYTGGILKPTRSSCNPYGLNHGVTLVGYGEENGTKYWIIKNSWGSSWGEEGYIRLQRGVGACGMNTAVSTAEIQ